MIIRSRKLTISFCNKLFSCINYIQLCACISNKPKYLKIKWLLTHFVALVSFSVSWKHQETVGSMHFWYQDTNLKKSLLIEKLDLTWNKQINSNKLGPFLRVFQIVLSSEGMGLGYLPGVIFLFSGGNLTRSDFDNSNFFKAKNNIL